MNSFVEKARLLASGSLSTKCSLEHSQIMLDNIDNAICFEKAKPKQFHYISHTFGSRYKLSHSMQLIIANRFQEIGLLGISNI